jgi:hypothetical protein
LSARIDLAAYAQELEAFAALAEDFVDKGSTLRLTDVVRELRTGVDLGNRRWSWATRTNIVFRPSTAYDGPGRVHGETWLELGFRFDFTRPANVRRQVTVWQIESASTHIRIHKEDGESSFHFDCKNAQQWGPQLHFQVAEDQVNLPIPRLVSAIFLPSDCADLALAELHHEEWRRLQAAGASARHVSVIRDAQENRTMTYLRNIEALWKGSVASTRICMLQDYTASFVTLPDHRGRTAASW